MKSNSYKYSSKNNNIKVDNKEISNLKEILSPMVLEVIGKKYTDIYMKRLGDKYYELIDSLTKKKKYSSFSDEGTKLYSDENVINNKNSDFNYNTNIRKNNSTYWKDYDFVNNHMIDKKVNILKNNNDNSLFVQISKNNKSNEEEMSESIIIKENEEIESEEN